MFRKNQMLGKAADRQAAYEMLKLLSDQTQTVYSAVAIIDMEKFLLTMMELKSLLKNYLMKKLTLILI